MKSSFPGKRRSKTQPLASSDFMSTLSPLSHTALPGGVTLVFLVHKPFIGQRPLLSITHTVPNSSPDHPSV